MEHSKQTQNVWQSTGTQYLLRHKVSRRYYARVQRNGKQVWKALRTKYRGIAERELQKFLNKHGKAAPTKDIKNNRKLTLGDGLKIPIASAESHVRRTRAVGIRQQDY